MNDLNERDRGHPTAPRDPGRRRLCAAIALAALAPGESRAQARGDAVRVLCGYPPGGSIDIVARKLAERLAARLARPVVVENRSGAAGRLAVEELTRAAADGATMLLTPASVVTMYPHVYRRLGYDVLADIVPVTTVATTGFALAVGPAVPAEISTVGAFVQWCRSAPGAAQCGNAGAGSMPHFMAMMMARELALDLIHVSYRGGSAAMQAVAAGEIPVALATEAAARPHHAAGRLRVLATSWPARSPFFPQSPSFRELGWPGLSQREWFGVFVPARTADAVVQAGADAIGAALDDDEVRALWARVGLAADRSSPSQLKSALRSELDFWGPVVKSSGFSPES